jgi:alkanesulfonate monooxygenase SsuD/methylene tetrahydromethanopterin reductase-like flavin-dependent oxidoreductase (luciferase family)
MFGATTAAELLRMAQMADESGLFRSVYVGDSLLGNPRLESVALLSAIAGCTSRVRLGTACMASFPLRDPVLLASQWASLDLISGGRSLLVVCTGNIGKDDEQRHYGTTGKDRVQRLIESIQILRLLWTQDHVTFEGEHFTLRDVSIGLRPAQQPRPPIWIANNARGDPALVDRTLRRVAKHADGWQTTIIKGKAGPAAEPGTPPEIFARRWGRILEHARELGRNPNELDNNVYYNIHVGEDRAAAFEESKRFLDAYYSTDWPPAVIESWVAYGSPDECVAKLRVWAELGAREITLRLTAWDQMGQLQRAMSEVLPRVQVVQAEEAYA